MEKTAVANTKIHFNEEIRHFADANETTFSPVPGKLSRRAGFAVSRISTAPLLA
jgi:hypothetical protein